MMEAVRKQTEYSGQSSPSVDAMWSLLLAAEYLRDRMDAVCESFHVTTSQFNVLRILRCVYPEGYARTEIARRMIERAPDVTRLVDRLEQQQLVERARSTEDRRLSVTRITDSGLRLLSQVEPEVRALERSCFAGCLTEHDCVDLLRMCRQIRSRVDFRRSLRSEELPPWSTPFTAPARTSSVMSPSRDESNSPSMMYATSAGLSGE